MNKTSLFSRLFNGYITDPLTQNFVIYIASYALSALLSSIPFLGILASSTADAAVATPSLDTFLWAFSDCVVPTTVTLTAGTVIQNIAKSQETNIRLRSSTIWAAIFTLIYMLLYAALHQQRFVCLPWIAIVSSFLISFLNLWTITQLEKEAVPDGVSAPPST